MPLLLNRDQVASLLSMAECIEAVQRAFAELADGTAVLPLRTSIPAPGGPFRTRPLPAWSTGKPWPPGSG